MNEQERLIQKSLNHIADGLKKQQKDIENDGGDDNLVTKAMRVTLLLVEKNIRDEIQRLSMQ